MIFSCKLGLGAGNSFLRIAFRMAERSSCCEAFRGAAFDKGLDKAMGDEGTGLFRYLPASFPGEQTIICRGMAARLFKETTKRTDALETHLIAYFGYRHRFPCQAQLSRFDPFSGKVLVRSHPVNTGKKPMKVKARDTGLAGEPVQVDGLAEISVDVELGRNDPPVYIRRDRHERIKIDSPKFNSCFSNLYKKLPVRYLVVLPLNYS